MAWSRVWSATGSRLFPSCCPALGSGLSSGLPTRKFNGSVSHSPKEALAWRGPSGSLTQVENIVATSASLSEEPKYSCSSRTCGDMPVLAWVSRSHSPSPELSIQGPEPVRLTTIGVWGRWLRSSKRRRLAITGSVAPAPKIAIDWPCPWLAAGWS